ncbi:hypothetical protein Pfo_018946, partial [Paulownia fortunei]
PPQHQPTNPTPYLFSTNSPPPSCNSNNTRMAAKVTKPWKERQRDCPSDQSRPCDASPLFPSLQRQVWAVVMCFLPSGRDGSSGFSCLLQSTKALAVGFDRRISTTMAVDGGG